MKYKTSELEGALLDAAVAMAEGLPNILFAHRSNSSGQWVRTALYKVPGKRYLVERRVPLYSSEWEQGGPIIERERIGFEPQQAFDVARGGLSLVEGSWHAHGGEWALNGPTPLVAAMRTYVANKFGEEVEWP